MTWKLGKTWRDAAAGLAAQGWTAALGLALLPFLLHALGPKNFGLLALNVALLNLAAVGDFGVGRAVAKFVSERAEEDRPAADATFSTGLTLTLLLGAAGAVLLWSAAPWIAGSLLRDAAAEGPAALRVTALTIPALLLRILFGGLLLAKRRLLLLSAAQAAADTAKVLLAVAAAYAGLALWAVVGGYALAAYLHVAVLGWHCFAGGAPPASPRPGWDRATAKRLIGFGSWGTAATVFRQLLGQSDRWILGLVAPLEAVGYYSVAREIASKQAYIPHHVARAFFPVFGRLFATDRAAMRRNYDEASRFVFVAAGGLGILLALFADPLLRTWIDAETAQRAAALLSVLALASMFEGFGEAPATAIFAGAGRPQLLATIYGAALAVHLALCGLTAAAYGSLAVAASLCLTMAAASWASAAWIDSRLPSPAQPGRPTAVLAVGGAGVLGAVVLAALGSQLTSLPAVAATLGGVYVLYLALALRAVGPLGIVGGAAEG